MGRIREVDGVYEYEDDSDYNDEVPECKYTAFNITDFHGMMMVSNNLQKLKERVKERQWIRALIVEHYKEPNRYGDLIADEFYYTPKYK